MLWISDAVSDIAEIEVTVDLEPASLLLCTESLLDDTLDEDSLAVEGVAEASTELVSIVEDDRLEDIA
jgi:hypothetical protein